MKKISIFGLFLRNIPPTPTKKRGKRRKREIRKTKTNTQEVYGIKKKKKSKWNKHEKNFFPADIFLKCNTYIEPERTQI